VKAFDSETLARLAAGEVDYFDAITGIFDSGVLNLYPGQPGGSFTFEDDVLGEQTFIAVGGLLSIDLAEVKAGNEAAPIKVRLAETYVPQGSTTPVNIFAEPEVRASIDGEDWQWREVILSVFWRAKTGEILCREQVARRVIDAMPTETDPEGNVVRVAVLEQPGIVQLDVEAKTDNAELQRLIDPADRFYDQAGNTARRQRINLGAMPEQDVTP
jgi:hypothetical protein